jgi:hypothetical protein
MREGACVANRLIVMTKGLDVDTVLGVSITGNAAGLVLLEGRAPYGVTVDRDAIDLAGAHAALTDVMAAVLRAQGSISATGHRLRAIGVTSSAGSEAKAGELVTMLTQFGLENIVAIRRAEATSTLTRTSERADADTAAPAVDASNASVAATAEAEMLLARGAALAVAHHASAEVEPDQIPCRERRRLNPSSVTAATILSAGTLAVLAATWFGLAPRHADTPIEAPVHQQAADPPAPQAPPVGATALPGAPGPPVPAGESPQRATPANAPIPTDLPASRSPASAGRQNPSQQPANASPATPIGQARIENDAPNAAQEPVNEEPAPPGPQAAPGPEPPPGPEPAPGPEPVPAEATAH